MQITIEQVQGYIAGALRQALDPIVRRIRQIELAVQAGAGGRPRSANEEIQAIPGRRIPFHPTAVQAFTADNDGKRGDPLTFTITQDGPFVMTHYPIIMWQPTLPTGATNYKRWRPVTTYPLPDQVVDADIIDISYEMQDTNNRGMQDNGMSIPPLISLPGKLVELSQWCYFKENSVISLIPTYENILFDGATPPTQGTLKVSLVGHRILRNVALDEATKVVIGG